MSANLPKFTPGPWAVRPDIGAPVGTLKIANPEWPRGASDPLVAAVFGTEQEQGANARLISAAPEMYEALRAMLAAFDIPGRTEVRSIPEAIQAIADARTALAKAEGRS